MMSLIFKLLLKEMVLLYMKLFAKEIKICVTYVRNEIKIENEVEISIVCNFCDIGCEKLFTGVIIDESEILR